MPSEPAEPFRTSRRRRGRQSYDALERVGYHLANLARDDDRIDPRFEHEALTGAVAAIFESFDVRDDARTLLRRSLSDTNMNSRVGLELELHIGSEREGLELEATELVRGEAVFSTRSTEPTSTKARAAIDEFRDVLADARRDRASVRLRLQRKHHRIRFGWETFDRPNEAVLQTTGGVVSRLKRAVS